MRIALILVLALPLVARGQTASVTTLTSPGFTPGVEPTKGAYFYKVSSPSSSRNTGVTGAGVLPVPSFDPARMHSPAFDAGEDEYARGPLDIPSVYVGGNGGGFELDAGLSWSRVLDPRLTPLWTDLPGGSDLRSAAHRFAISDGQTTLLATDGNGRVLEIYATDGSAVMSVNDLAGKKVDLVAQDGTTVSGGVVLQADFAFRPFWRTIVRQNGTNVNQWANPEPGDPGFQFFYPGERFTMSLETVKRDTMRLRIASLDDTAAVTDETFEQAGFGEGSAASFKRVNSIDQFRVSSNGAKKGNEGNPAIPTATRVQDGRWDDFYLLEGGTRVPFTGPSFVEKREGEFSSSEFESIFHRSGFNSAGGEALDIDPPSPTPGMTGALGR